MKKRIVLILSVALLVLGASAVEKAVYKIIEAQIRPDFTVEIDGIEREFRNAAGEEMYPILHNGTTYLPVRAIGEIMGKTVYWYENEKRIELREEKAGKNITVTDADVIVSDVNKPQSEKSANISSAQAKKIALDKAGMKESEVKFIKTEFEKDDGIYIYDIEFRKGYTEYNAEIRADNGQILDWDIDIED